MTRNSKESSTCNGVMVCGASAALLNHEPGEPTAFDLILNAFTRMGHRSNKRTAIPARRLAN